MEILAFLFSLFGIGTGATFLVIKNYYYICQPSEVLIFAGSSQKSIDGKNLGYRLVKGGSSIRTPLLEEVFKMDLTNMIIELKVVNAYSKGGVPLTVEGVANIKIAGEEPIIHNAIERLLGKKRSEIESLAKETLEGNLRGVLADLTPEEANADQIKFAKQLLEEAEKDLQELGLVLDNLQIQNISDDVHYLDSIGRKQQAELIRDARIAEAQAQAESIIQNSMDKKTTSLRKIEKDLAIAKIDAEKRVRDAQTKRTAMIAEVESLVMAELAKVQAEVAVQKERILQVQQQLQADVIAPAEANCKQVIAKAQGKASQIIEDGKAQAEGAKQLAQSWKLAGVNAKEVFLYQKLELLMKLMVSSVPEINIDQITIIDGEKDATIPKMATFIEQLRQTTGVDINAIAQNFSNNHLLPTEIVNPDKNA